MKLSKSQKPFMFFIMAGIIIILDQITKYFVTKLMIFGQSIPLIQNIFHLTYVRNTGIGFSLFQNQNTVMIWVVIAILGFILFYFDRIPNQKWPVAGFALVFGGGIGNLIDRIIFGSVIDFLDFRIWPVFNIADSSACIGVIILIVYFWKK